MLGRSINSAEKYKAQMIAAGFVDVTEVRFKWPSNQWPRDKKLKEMGESCIPSGYYFLSRWETKACPKEFVWAFWKPVKVVSLMR